MEILMKLFWCDMGINKPENIVRMLHGSWQVGWWAGGRGWPVVTWPRCEAEPAPEPPAIPLVTTKQTTQQSPTQSQDERNRSHPGWTMWKPDRSEGKKYFCSFWYSTRLVIDSIQRHLISICGHGPWGKINFTGFLFHKMFIDKKNCQTF